jgi:hypothetical protein
MKETINFNFQNNTNGTVPISVFGNNANTMDTLGATTQYNWDISSLNFIINNTVSLQYQSVGAPSFTTAVLPLPSQNIQGLLDALNTLNIGFFFTTTSGLSTFLNNYNLNVIFGQLNVYNASLITLFDFYQGSPDYNNPDTSVLDLSDVGNNGVPVLGTGNGTPTTLTYMQSSPFNYLQVPSSPAGTQFAIRLNNACQFAGTLPYTLVTWFSNTDTQFTFTNLQQGLIAGEGRVGGTPIGYSTYNGFNGGFYNVSHERFNLLTAVNAQQRLRFGVEIPTTFIPNAYYMVAAGFDGTTMYLSLYSTNQQRYDLVLPNTYSLTQVAGFSAFLGLRYANWLNGTVGFAAIFNTWTGYATIDNIYNQTKSRYGY